MKIHSVELQFALMSKASKGGSSLDKVGWGGSKYLLRVIIFLDSYLFHKILKHYIV